MKILLLDPGNKFRNLFARAMQNHSILIVAIVFLITEFARISILEMSIGSQHREVERFAFCCNLGQTVFGEGEEFFVLIAPPFVVVFRDQALLLCPVVIVIS